MLTHSSQILHGDQIGQQENFYRLDHAPSPGEISFVTQNNDDARSVSGN